MEKLKVLVVDHSVVNRKNITDIVNATNFGLVVRSASSGQIAMEWLEQSHFDVILMDVFVVKEIGLTQIQTLKTTYPNTEIIIMSDKDSESANITLEAMNRGALDFILRSSEKNATVIELGVKNELEAIFTQIKVRQFLPPSKMDFEETPTVTRHKDTRTFNGEVDLILIASSTGGPVALEMICDQIPSDFTKPVLIVQHMPPEFTEVLATAINKKCYAAVSEAKVGMQIKPRHVMLAPGGFHMILEEGMGKTVAVQLLDTPFVNGVKPSADVLFESVAKVYKGRNILAVVLTGMGNDGTRGIRALKEACNCYCLTQSEKTCVVYGMPKCVYEAGLSDEVVHLKDMAYRMYQLAHNKG